MAILKGNEIQLFYNSKVIAFSTNHTLTLNSDVTEISSKDHGEWGQNTVNRITWEIASESLTSSYTSGVNGFDVLFDAMVAKQPIDVVFARPSNYDVNGLTRGGNTASDAPTEWTAETSYFSGKALITNLQLNAPSGENSTFSMTATGSGPLSKVGSYIL